MAAMTCKRRMIAHIAFLCFAAMVVAAGPVEDHASKIAPLIDPGKLATLGPRGANPRVQKYVYWLEMARRETANVTNVVNAALLSVGMTNRLAVEVTRTVVLR